MSEMTNYVSSGTYTLLTQLSTSKTLLPWQSMT